MTLIKTTAALSTALFLASAPLAFADSGTTLGGAPNTQMKGGANTSTTGRSAYAPKKNDSMSKTAGPAISKTGGAVPK